MLVVRRIHPDDRWRIRGFLTALRTRGATEHAAEYRIVHQDGSIRTLRATVAVVSDGRASDETRLVGLVQDVTLARRLDRQLAAHVAVTQALDEWTSLESGATGLIAGLAHALEVPFAAFWVPDGPSLAARVIWHEPSSDLSSVAETTRAWQPGLGSATVGRAFIQRRPIIVREASAGSPSARATAIRHAGLGGALLIPAVDGDETLAVCEFLLVEPPAPTERFLRVLKGIGHEIGHFLSHRSGEMTVSVLTPRELDVLQLVVMAARPPAASEMLHALGVAC